MHIRYLLSCALTVLATIKCVAGKGNTAKGVAVVESAVSMGTLLPHFDNNVSHKLNHMAGAIADYAGTAAYFHEHEFVHGHIRAGRSLYLDDLSTKLHYIDIQLIIMMTPLHFINTTRIRYNVPPYKLMLAQEIVDNFHETGWFSRPLVKEFGRVSINHNYHVQLYATTLLAAIETITTARAEVELLLSSKAFEAIQTAPSEDSIDGIDITYVREYSSGADYTDDRRRQQSALYTELVRIKEGLLQENTQLANNVGYLQSLCDGLSKQSDDLGYLPNSDYQSSPDLFLKHLHAVIRLGNDERIEEFAHEKRSENTANEECVKETGVAKYAEEIGNEERTGETNAASQWWRFGKVGRM